MKKLSLLVFLSLAFAGQASAAEITGRVVKNITPIQKVCDALLLKNDERCENKDDYLVVAIITKETDTPDYHEVEAVNALVKKENLAKYLNKNVKAVIKNSSIAHIVEVVN